MVIDIDHTDLGGDVIRYKDLIIRDGANRIVGVRRTPVKDLFWRGFEKIQRQPIYFVRLIQKIYHAKIFMPRAIEEYRKKDPRRIFTFPSDYRTDSKERCAKEIQFFENNLSELAETLIDQLGDKNRIMFVNHIYSRHIKSEGDGHLYNSIVSDSVKKIADKYQIYFYNATEDLKKSFGDHPEKYYWTKDTHFNFEGLKIYSDFIALRLNEMISAQTN